MPDTQMLNWMTGQDAFAITPSDSANLARPCTAIYVGTASAGQTVRLTTLAGNVVDFKVTSFQTLQQGATKVWSTGTTATDLVAQIS